MGVSQSQEDKRVVNSQNIDRILNEGYTREKKTVKLLLLGKIFDTEWAKQVDFCNFLNPKIYFSKNGPSRGNFMWGINCAHSRTLKMLSWA